MGAARHGQALRRTFADFAFVAWRDTAPPACSSAVIVGAGDPAAMAVELFALLWGDLLLQLLLRVADPPTPQAMERKAREATEKFLRLYPEPHGS
jgi:hypothetical protein